MGNRSDECNGCIAKLQWKTLSRSLETLLPLWKPCYHYENITHILCNAHHMRELERVWEQDKQKWGKEMMKFLLDLNQEVNDAGGVLIEVLAKKRRERYRDILKEGERGCPPPIPPPEGQKKRGR